MRTIKGMDILNLFSEVLPEFEGNRNVMVFLSLRNLHFILKLLKIFLKRFLIHDTIHIMLKILWIISGICLVHYFFNIRQGIYDELYHVLNFNSTCFLIIRNVFIFILNITTSPVLFFCYLA